MEAYLAQGSGGYSEVMMDLTFDVYAARDSMAQGAGRRPQRAGGPRHAIWYEGGMEDDVATNGEPCPGAGLTASTRSGQPSYVVNCPLPTARIAWLRQQSKHVAAAAHLRYKSDAR